MTGTDMTKQWLHSSHADRITKLGMTCLTSAFTVGTGRTASDNAGVAFLSRFLLVLVICVLFAAILILTCAWLETIHVDVKLRVPLYEITKNTLLVFARVEPVMAECLQTSPFFSYAP